MSSEQARSGGITWGTVAASMIGPALVWLLAMVYLTAPAFSLEWVIRRGSTEYQVVELTTFGAAFVAALMLGVVALKLWFLKAPDGTRPVRIGAMAVGLIGAASFVFAMEEVSWGQTFIGWETPEGYSEFSRETNIHNSEIPLQSLGSVFIIVMFLVLPLLWRFRQKWNLPQGLAPAIAWGPSVVCMLSAFVWKEWKGIYRAIHPDYEEHAVYDEFFHNISEHKEMLIAVGILIYAVERVRAWRRLKKG